MLSTDRRLTLGEAHSIDILTIGMKVKETSVERQSKVSDRHRTSENDGLILIDINSWYYGISNGFFSVYAKPSSSLKTRGHLAVCSVVQ